MYSPRAKKSKGFYSKAVTLKLLIKGGKKDSGKRQKGKAQLELCRTPSGVPYLP